MGHTHNGEDQVLQRLLAGVEKGCYVDVGASHPILASNTFAFYQQGWRGICIEPLPLSPLWANTRPGDVFVNSAAGGEAGELTLRVFSHTSELSTASSNTIAHWAEHGRHPDISLTVPVTTLDSILDHHLNGRELHLMSIDVEGMESEVLRGLSLDRYRPWVLVIEATLPGTRTSSSASWEPLLAAADYLFVHDDGYNRFYIRREQAYLQANLVAITNSADLS